MRPILGRGITSHTAEEREARKRSLCEHTVNGNVDTTYRKLLRRSASLDLETTFKRIKISQTVKPELCSDCQKQKCQCPAFTPEMPCSSASSTPIKVDSDQEDIPKLLPEATVQNCIHQYYLHQMRRQTEKWQKSAKHLFIIG